MNKQNLKSKAVPQKKLSERKYLMIIISGIVFSLPFFAEWLFFCSYIGAALLTYTICRDTEDGFIELKKPFRMGYLFGISFYIPLYHWFIALYPFEAFDFTPGQGIFIIIAACVGISMYQSLFWGTAFWLLSQFRIRTAFFPALLASLWAVVEWIMSIGELGFSWGRVALAQTSLLPGLQTASLFGSYFITLVVIASGGYIGLAMRDSEKRRQFALVGLLIFTLNLSVGTLLYIMPENRDKAVSAAVLQGNISSAEKWDNEGKLSKETYLALFDSAVSDGGYNIIVFPESAFPVYYNKNSQELRLLQETATEKNVTIITGALTSKGGKNYNSLISIYPDGRESEIYSKRRLAPFGEYLPYRSFFENALPFVTEFNLAEDAFTSGEDASLIATDYGKAGGLICFDSIFEDISRESAAAGAEFFVLATNDSWFRDTAGIRQHANFAKLRAIENGRYVIRAANTGISMFINTKGETVLSLPAMEKGIIGSNIFINSKKTLYTVCGDTALYAALAVTAAFMIYTIYYKLKNKVLRKKIL